VRDEVATCVVTVAAGCLVTVTFLLDCFNGAFLEVDLAAYWRVRLKNKLFYYFLCCDDFVVSNDFVMLLEVDLTSLGVLVPYRLLLNVDLPLDRS
jgi:hypothetical protein